MERAGLPLDDTSRYDVFISYAHKDEREFGYAADLARALKARGITVWYDKELMSEGGAHWHRAITRKMEDATVIVALWSKLALSRPMCRFEATYASGTDKLLPVGLEEIGLSDFTEELAGLTYVLQRSDWDVAGLVEQIDARLKARAAAKAHQLSYAKLGPAPTSVAQLARERVNLPSTLSSGAGLLAGRENEERLLINAWASTAPHADPKSKTNIVVLHAIGGAGKTSLLRRLVDRLAADEFPNAEKVLGWSAYSQGSAENRNADSDTFIIDALRFMGELNELPKDSVARARLLVSRLREKRTLFLLDGIEPLQSMPDVDGGRLKDRGLQRVIQDLAFGHPGLLVITSRQHLPELEKRETPGVISHALDKLSAKSGALLLRRLGCWGPKRETEMRALEEAADEAHGHALSVTLLGSYINAVEAGNIARRDYLGLRGIIDTSPEQHATDQTARLAKRAGAIMDAYIAHFKEREKETGNTGEVERLLLSTVGLFDRPADGAAVRTIFDGDVIPGFTDVLASWAPHTRRVRIDIAKSRLRDLKLLLETDDPDGLDAHPLVRGHFGAALFKRNPQAFRTAHERLYRHYAAAAPELPESLRDIQPLLQALGHACAAGLAQEAWVDVYRKRIYRGGASAYIIKQLGAPAANLTALAHFFDPPWATLREDLTSEVSRRSALGRAGFALRALGRLTDAEVSTSLSLALCLEQRDSKNAALDAGNLSELRLALGRVAAAIETGALAVFHADASGDMKQMCYQRTTYADALVQGGRTQEAMACYAEAEKKQAELEPSLPQLYSLQGYRYWDFLLENGAADDVRERIAYAKRVTQSRGLSLLTRGLDALADARVLACYAAHSDQESRRNAGFRMDEAIEALRIAGDEEILIHGLLVRGRFHRQNYEHSLGELELKAALEDLSEAHDISWRGGMKLHLADWRLESARLSLAQIRGAPREELLPLRDSATLFDTAENVRATEAAQTNETAPHFEGRIDSVTSPPSTLRADPLTSDERSVLSGADEHYRAAAALIGETGYRRRNRERRDLRARLEVLAALG